MPKRPDSNRYVLLTEAGLNRLHTARRTYRTTVADLVGDMETPSVNTIKRVLRQEPVFVSTLERLWDYLQRCAAKQGEALPALVAGKDYRFTEAKGRDTPVASQQTEAAGQRRGWISRQTPRSNRLFTGRREALERLHAALWAGNGAQSADPQALTGLGGMGKTQTAIAYLYTYRRDYDYLFWVGAETVETLHAGLASLAEELELIPVNAPRQQALTRIYDWFRTHDHWLLVIDNADDLPALAPHFPPSHTGHLIFTTRAANTVKWAAPVALVRFGREEGAALTLRRAGLLGIEQSPEAAPADLLQAAEELCAELDGLPLALNQAGAYLAETACTLRDYLSRYREAGLRLLDSVVDPEHASVTVTFTLALEQIAACAPYGAQAAELVRLCAFLHPDAIPQSVLAADTTAQKEIPAAVGETLAETLCTLICGYSLASRQRENGAIGLHRLVQRVIQDTMPEDKRRLWEERAVRAVSAATPDFEYEDWTLCERLLPQWRLCEEYIRRGQIETAEAAYLLYQAGRYLRARALYEEARVYLQRAVAIAEKAHGESDPMTADCLDELACLLRSLDHREEAESLHLQAVAIMEAAAGADDPLTAGKLHNLAVLYVQYGEYSRAVPLFLRALAIYESRTTPDLFVVAATLTQLAGGYRIQGDFDRAELHCRRALEIYESLLEPDHIEIATACNNLALLYWTMARYEEAETLYLRALAINEIGRGKEHPETANVVLGLARVRWSQGHVADADLLFRRALHIYTLHFDSGHARVTRARVLYAQFQQETSSAER